MRWSYGFSICETRRRTSLLLRARRTWSRDSLQMASVWHLSLPLTTGAFTFLLAILLKANYPTYSDLREKPEAHFPDTITANLTTRLVRHGQAMARKFFSFQIATIFMALVAFG